MLCQHTDCRCSQNGIQNDKEEMGNSLKHSEEKKRKQGLLFEWTKINGNQKRKERGEGDGKKKTERGESGGGI